MPGCGFRQRQAATDRHPFQRKPCGDEALSQRQNDTRHAAQHIHQRRPYVFTNNQVILSEVLHKTTMFGAKHRKSVSGPYAMQSGPLFTADDIAMSCVPPQFQLCFGMAMTFMARPNLHSHRWLQDACVGKASFPAYRGAVSSDLSSAMAFERPLN